MTRIALRGCALLVSLTFVACGGDSETEGEKVCKDVAAKLDECGLMLPSGTRCDDTGGEATLCSGRCLADATCEDIASNATDTAYIRCVAACSGASPDDFICASGNAFVPAAAVCDGTPHCPDGSDEADCGSAGDGGAG